MGVPLCCINNCPIGYSRTIPNKDPIRKIITQLEDKPSTNINPKNINYNNENQSVNPNPELSKRNQNVQIIDRNTIINSEQVDDIQLSNSIHETQYFHQNNENILLGNNMNINGSENLIQTGQDISSKQIIDYNNYINQININNFGNNLNEIISPNYEYEQNDYKNYENINPYINQKEQYTSFDDNLNYNYFEEKIITQNATEINDLNIIQTPNDYNYSTEGNYDTLNIPYDNNKKSEYYNEINNNETNNILEDQINNIIESKEIKEDIFINIIYLVDLTYSMKKHRKIINNINEINLALKEKYPNIIFGYVFYRDFEYNKSQTLQLNLPHIKVFKSTSLNVTIPDDCNFVRDYTFNLKFEGGFDYAEDWANPYYEISQFNIDYNYENIVIHFCDAGAHGKKFSDYDDNNDQEKLLVEALKHCSLKKIKIIGLIFNEFSRKSFLECQNIYNKEQEGYYNIVDLTYLDLDHIDWISLIKENIEKSLKNIINENFDDYTKIPGFEKGFDFDDIKNIQMLNLEFIKNKYFENKNIKFLPDFDNSNTYYILNKYGNYTEIYQRKKTNNEIINNAKFRDAIKQGDIGDCYLIASMISILFGNIPLIRYIFPLYQNYDENTKTIFMYVFKNGYRKLISFKNTYPIQVDKEHNSYSLPFAKPLNDSFALICIEKGYAAFKSDKKTIELGFNKIEGGFSFNVFNDLLGTNTEIIFKKKENFQKKYIENELGLNTFDLETDDKATEDVKKNFLKILKKYLDYRGLVTFNVRFNISRGGHAFAVIGYKENALKNEFLIEILNPWHSGEYIENNIKKNEEYNNLDYTEKYHFDKEIEGENITEEEFDEPELKKAFDNYGKTGYLIMKFNTFFKWFTRVDLCDPMI